MDRPLSPASGLPESFRSLFHLQSFPKAVVHQDKGWTRVETIPSVQADWPASTITGVRENQHLAFHGLERRFFSQHYHVKHHLHFRNRQGCSLTGMEQSKESPFPSSMSSFEVGRIKSLSSAWKIGRVGRNEEPGSSDLL